MIRWALLSLMIGLMSCARLWAAAPPEPKYKLVLQAPPAAAVNSVVASPDGPHADRRAAIDELKAAAGQRYGPDVVQALAAVIGVRQRSSRRRRRGDEATGVRGAA